MNQTRSNTLNSTKAVTNKTQKFKSKILVIIFSLIIISNVFQVNIFAQETNNVLEADLKTQLTQGENEEPTSEEPTGEDISDETAGNTSISRLSLVSGVQTQEASAYSLVNPADASGQYRITYHSNYPSSSGLTNSEYLDPVVYESHALANAAYLSQTGFVVPENYYFTGWNSAPNLGTAKYAEGVLLSEIDVDWDLYAIYMPYSTMEWTINNSSYTSDYNAQSHTNSISWPTAQSTSWGSPSISGLTYTYSVNGGAFSATKPSLVDAGNYTVTVKASAPRYIEITTTVNVTINKVPLNIYPDISGSHAFESLTGISHSIPAVNATNGPKSQSDESAINSALSKTASLFTVLDSDNDIVSDLKTALPGQYTVNISSSTLASLQNNSAFRNYILNANSANFSITSLNTLSVTAKPLNTVYSAQYHNAVYSISSNIANAKIEYSIDNSAFSTAIPQVKDAGSYKIQIRASVPGYNSATITLTAIVEKRDAILNIANHSKVAGVNDPAFVASFSGLQGSDEIAYTLKRTAGEAVGEYVITADIVSNKNYNVTVSNGLLIITVAPVTPVDPDEPTSPGTSTEEPETDIATDEPETETETESEQLQALDFTTSENEEFTALNTEEPSTEEQNQPQVDIGDVELPLSRAESSWALLNLILAILTAIISLVLVIGYYTEKRKNSEYNNDEQVKHKGFVRFSSIIIAFVSIILFVLTQNMQLQMVFVDKWTVIMILLTLAQIVVSLLAKKVVIYNETVEA